MSDDFDHHDGDNDDDYDSDFDDFNDFDHSQPYRPQRPPEIADDFDDYDHSQPYIQPALQQPYSVRAPAPPTVRLPPEVLTRTYPSSAAYQVEATQLAQQGWTVASINQEQRGMSGGGVFTMSTVTLILCICLFPIGIIMLIISLAAFATSHRTIVTATYTRPAGLYTPAYQPAQLPPHASRPITMTPSSPGIGAMLPQAVAASNNPFQPAFWRNMSTLKVSIVTVVSALLVLCMCGTLLSVVAKGTGGASQAGIVAPTATDISTLPPQPTATPKPLSQQPIDRPTLGGLRDYFEHTYGAELNGQQDTWGATIAGQQVEIMVDFSSHAGDSADGQSRAAIINLVVPQELVGQERWSSSTANAIAHAFLPADAKYVSDRQFPGWVDHTERSSRLAASFTPNIFTTEDLSKVVTPGDLHWFCDLTTQLSNCYVSVGTSN